MEPKKAVIEILQIGSGIVATNHRNLFAGLMKYIIAALFLVFSACTQNDRSSIEVIRFGKVKLDSLASASDSIKRLPDNATIKVYQDNYYLKDGSVFWVWTDKKSGIVRGTKRVKRDTTYTGWNIIIPLASSWGM